MNTDLKHIIHISSWSHEGFVELVAAVALVIVIILLASALFKGIK